MTLVAKPILNRLIKKVEENVFYNQTLPLENNEISKEALKMLFHTNNFEKWLFWFAKKYSVKMPKNKFLKIV